MARFTPDTLEKWYLVLSIADPDAPTDTEMAAGTDITGMLSSVSGFSKSTGNVPTPTFDTDFTTTIPGRITVEDSSLEFYASDTSGGVNTVLAALPQGTPGYICRFFPIEGAAQDGETTGDICDVWPINVLSNNPNTPVVGEPAKVTVGLSHPDEPGFDIEIVDA